eukprot:8818932-Pyramimonas_sp.AAC.1
MATHHALLHSSATGLRMQEPSIKRDPQLPNRGEVGVGSRDPGRVISGLVQCTRTSPLSSGLGE